MWHPISESLLPDAPQNLNYSEEAFYVVLGLVSGIEKKETFVFEEAFWIVLWTSLDPGCYFNI